MGSDNSSGSCVTAKVRYDNDYEASVALERVREARVARPDGNPPERQFYFCGECDGWHLSSKPPLLGPEPPAKHDGETWAEYALRLERRIKEQRDQLESINALRADAGNRAERKRIEFLLFTLGKLTEKHQRERTARLALVHRVRELENRLAAPPAAQEEER